MPQAGLRPRAKRTGKQEELIEKWKTRLLLEVGTALVRAIELRAAGSAAEGFKVASDVNRTVEVGEDISRGAFKSAAPLLENTTPAKEASQSLQSADGLPKDLPGPI